MQSRLRPMEVSLHGEVCKLDIDHFIPLAEAHASGGFNWSEQQKARYANDLEARLHLAR